MGKITLAQAAQWCGGQVEDKYADVTFLGACGDHRWAQPGELFVTLEEGEHVCESIRVALEKGAVAVLCSTYSPDYPCIVVPNPRRALGDIARQERKRIGMRVVGVTGSVGKTTVTEMIACVLDGTYRVGKTLSNQFEDIGVPMAILSMPADTEVAVLEMGMNQFREIAYLTSVARPDIAVITNVGGAGDERLSREETLRAKLEILEGMRENSKVILGGDDALLWEHRNISRVSTVCYGIDRAECAVRADELRTEDGILRFVLHAPNLRFPMELPLQERHFVCDCLAAVCVGLEMGVPPEQIQERLSRFRERGRVDTSVAAGVTVLRDSRNAGPESMRLALEDLGRIGGRRVAVLGDMLDLGVCTQAEHYRIGRIAAENAQIVLALGANAPRVVSGAVTGGMNPARIHAFEEGEKLLQTLEALVKPGDTVLFKGGRFMGMEKLADSFTKRRKQK
jgi:UDP-N-acetylmuramoyl-tripeptide--D-alanyl-D-alanine ligase